MKLICIACPNGCHLTVRQAGTGLRVTGHSCVRGEAYGIDEATDPKRVVTCVVRTGSAQWPCVPVKTDTAIPKKLIAGLLKELYSLQVTLPVQRGEMVLQNFNDTQVNVVYTRTVPPILGGSV